MSNNNQLFRVIPLEEYSTAKPGFVTATLHYEEDEPVWLEPVGKEDKESDAIAFAEWMDENCTFNVKGWFFDDLIGDQVQNEYSIPELYEIFKSTQNGK